MKHTGKQPYFTKVEKWLWLLSVGCITASFLLFDRNHYLTWIASLVGTSSLIFNAKGNPFGQILMILFSLLYGIISYSCAYYGEMITYLGMTAPMALFALISWLKHPYQGNRAEVQVQHLQKRELGWISLAAVVITGIFYWILKVFHTANIIPSTVSVTTSFAAVYLTYRRSAYFALAYAANDIVLVLLWALASRDDSAYISVLVCFLVFLVNDIYGFISWHRMQKRQLGGRAE